MLREGSARTAFSQGPAVPIVPSLPGTQAPVPPHHPRPSWHWACESVPDIEEVPNRGSFHFCPRNGPRLGEGWDGW